MPAKLFGGAAKPTIRLVRLPTHARFSGIGRKGRPVCAIGEILGQLGLSRSVRSISTWAVHCGIDQCLLARRVIAACRLANHFRRCSRRRPVVSGQALSRPLLIYPHGTKYRSLIPDCRCGGICTSELIGEFCSAELVWVGKVFKGGSVERSDIGHAGEEWESVGQV